MADVGSLLGGLGVGGNIGKAIVQLELDTAKYRTEMATAEAQTKTSTSKLGGSLSAFGGIAKTAFLGAGVAAVAGLGYSVKAAIEAEDALNKLDNTLQNNSRLSDVSRQSFIDLAGSLRDLTGADDEAIIASQALLGQFEVTGQQVQELTPLIVDLSAKMGIDMEAAAKAVGKAVIGNTGGLQRYGIAIEEASGSGGEFTAVLEGLQGTVGGFAKQRAIDEPWRILGAQFEEVAETIGLALLPIIRSLIGFLQDLVPVLKFVANNLDLVALGLASLAAYKALPALMNTLGISIAGLGGNAAIAAAAVTLLVIGLQQMSTVTDRANEGLTRMVNEGVKQFADEAYASDAALIKFGSDMLIASDNALTLQASLDPTQVAVHALREAFTANKISQDEFADALTALGLKQEDVQRIISETANEADNFRYKINDAGKEVRNFGNMTNKEFREFRTTARQSFHDFIFDMEAATEETRISREEFRVAFNSMEEDARRLGRAMARLKEDDWVNDRFLEFLNTLGPEYLITFSRMNDEEQRKWQEQWRTTGDIVKTKVNDRFDELIGILDNKIDNKTTRHTVQVKYEYVNFDPTKPGMSGSGQVR